MHIDISVLLVGAVVVFVAGAGTATWIIAKLYESANMALPTERKQKPK